MNMTIDALMNKIAGCYSCQAKGKRVWDSSRTYVSDYVDISILHEEKCPQDAIRELMSRPGKEE